MSNIRDPKIWEKYHGIALEEAKGILDKNGAIKETLSYKLDDCICCHGKLTNAKPQGGFSECSRCDTLQANPRPLSSTIEKLRQPDSALSYFHKHVVMLSRDRRYKLFQERLKEINHLLCSASDKILDIGCSIGVFLDVLKDSGYRCEGVEAVSTSAEIGRSKGHIVHNQTVEELELPNSSFGLITMWEVICHLENPILSIEKIFQWLMPGGYLVISATNALALEYDFIWEDNKRHHFNLEPHIFQQIFSVEALGVLLRQKGFNLIECKTPGTMDLQNISDYSMRTSKRLKKGLLQRVLDTPENLSRISEFSGVSNTR